MRSSPGPPGLARPHRSGGQVIERAAILAAGADSPASSTGSSTTPAPLSRPRQFPAAAFMMPDSRMRELHAHRNGSCFPPASSNRRVWSREHQLDVVAQPGGHANR
jgi:hypothetical protein